MDPLYKINSELKTALENAESQAIDNNGEISEYLAAILDTIDLKRSEKIGNICRYYKSLIAESEMVDNEAKLLSERAKTTKKKAENLKLYLSLFMDESEKFFDCNSKISWRKSVKVKANENVTFYDEIYHNIDITLNKTKIKTDIKNGIKVEGAELIEKQNIQIK